MENANITENKSERLRKFLVGHANINGGKTVIFFFSKSDKYEQSLGPPVKVSFSKMTVEKECYQYGHSVYAETLTNGFCEKIIWFSQKLNLNVFFSVPALFKNTRKQDDFMGLGCAFLDDVPAVLSGDLFSKSFRLGDFPFPTSVVIQTSPGKFQVIWNFKGFLPADDRYQGPKASFLPGSSKYRKELFNRLLRQLKKRLKGDPGGSNLNQIYRVPFTLNHKPKYSPAPEVELLYADFSPDSRVNFGEFYAELLMPELKNHYQDNFSEVFSNLRKNNDWIVMDNLLGWGESAEDLGRSWTANERDLSVARRLYEYYKIPRETIEKIILQSPNRQKGQTKGEKYFDTVFSKLKKQPGNEKSGAISIHRRTTIDLIRVFSNFPALLFSNAKTVSFKGVYTSEGRKVDVDRVGKVGMNNNRVKILLWALSSARNRVGGKYIGRTIEIPFEKFAREMLDVAPENYKTEGKFKKIAGIYYKRIVKGLEFLRFGISDYYQLKKTGNSEAMAISPFQSFKKEGNKVIITLDPEMEDIYSEPLRLKRLGMPFLQFLGHTHRSLVPALALWLGENFYDKRNARKVITIKPTELKHILQSNLGEKEPEELSENARNDFRDKIYQAVHDINNKDLLRQVGASARQVVVKSDRNSTKLEFSVSQIHGKKSGNT